jgi:hypothetical protein
VAIGSEIGTDAAARRASDWRRRLEALEAAAGRGLAETEAPFTWDLEEAPSPVEGPCPACGQETVIVVGRRVVAGTLGEIGQREILTRCTTCPHEAVELR